ncbi:hypothetical protein JM66_19980 [Aeromonas bestiarum]|nr:hypothetical protein JM66_19980 [Aeromonas bestiarum]
MLHTVYYMIYQTITTVNLEYRQMQLLTMRQYGLSNSWIINLIIGFILLHISPEATLKKS